MDDLNLALDIFLINDSTIVEGANRCSGERATTPSSTPLIRESTDTTTLCRTDMAIDNKDAQFEGIEAFLRPRFRTHHRGSPASQAHRTTDYENERVLPQIYNFLRSFDRFKYVSLSWSQLYFNF